MYRVIEKNIENGVYRIRVTINEDTQETAFFQFFSDPSQEQVDSAVFGLLQPLPATNEKDQLLQQMTQISQAIENLTPSISGIRLSSRQIRLWLIQNGISLQSVNDAISNIPDSTLRDSVGIEWEYAPYIERSHPMLLPLAQALGLTETDIDRAFIEGANL